MGRRTRRLFSLFKRPVSIRETFSNIYANNTWGGEPGSFYSGEGSHKQELVSSCKQTLLRLADREGFRNTRFVDLGCGDFNIGRQLIELSSSYTGIEVVPELVQHLQVEYGSDAVSFHCLDITMDALPHGEVCLVRQVLQHLSNRQIQQVLGRLTQYRWVLIMEHHPEDGPKVRPNLDQSHGQRIRIHDRSGIYLDQPPFSIPSSQLELVDSTEINLAGTPGLIRTYLWKPAEGNPC